MPPADSGVTCNISSGDGKPGTRICADVEGHPDEQAMKWAFEELDFFTTEWTMLGTYPASPFRG